MTEITIPSDDDGFVLLQCHLCGEYFKLRSVDVNDDSNINIWCPYCGLNGKQYVPEEAISIGMRIAENEINELIYNSFKNLERKNKNGFLQIKCNKKTAPNVISPIKSRISNLVSKKYTCCGSVAKIRPISKMTGSYCPICGGIDYE